MLRFIRVKPAREVFQNHNVIDEKQFPLQRIALGADHLTLEGGGG